MVEGRVSGAAQQGGALLEERRVVALARVEGADDLGVRDVVRPVDAQGVGGAAQPGDGTVRGDREGAQDAGARLGHEVGGGHAGEQGELGVPALGGERGAVGEAVGAVLYDDLLLGNVQRDAAARQFLFLAQSPDLPEQGEGFLGRARVDLPLDPRVVELRAAADQGPGHVGGDGPPVAVQVDAPERGRAHLAGEEAGGALGEGGGVEGDAVVGEVEGGDPAVCLGVERAARPDEGGDVRDGVVDPVAASPALQVHRLVQVRGGGRVDGEERQVRGVLVGRQVRGPHRLLRLGHRPVREAGGEVEFGAQGAQGGPEGAVGRSGHTQMAAGHGPSVGRDGGCGIRGPGPCRGPSPSRGPDAVRPGRAQHRTGSPAPPPYPCRGPGEPARPPGPRLRRTYEGEPPCSCCCRPPKERPPRGAGLP